MRTEFFAINLIMEWIKNGSQINGRDLFRDIN